MNAAPTNGSETSSGTGTPGPGIDRQYVATHYLRNLEWRDKLNRQFTHRALDIPEDDGMQNVGNRTYQGLGWKELAVIAASLLGAGGLGAMAMRAPSASAVAPVVERIGPNESGHYEPAAGPIDSEYEVRFYDSDGRLIEVPRRLAVDEGSGQ